MKKFVLLVAALSVMPLIASAQSSGSHPAYEHASADLQLAKEKIEHRRPEDGAIAHDEDVLLQEIDFALGDLHRADLVDQKLQNIPPPDTDLPPGRLHAAEALLRIARSDIARREDNPRAQPDQAHAVEHIDRALQAAHHVIQDRHRD